MYKFNPKMAKSGMLGCIPQTGRCPNECEDCFFQGGRSFLEPLDENLPNMPTAEQAEGRVVRINDGNDSNVQRGVVINAASRYAMKFFNTAIPKDLGAFPAPVVLTVNPGGMTDETAHLVDECPPNLMFVRFRTNTWNLDLCDEVVEHYASREVPIILTFMAYFAVNADDRIPKHHQANYIWRKRTMNAYWAITTDAWRQVKGKLFPEFEIVCDYCGCKGVMNGVSREEVEKLHCETLPKERGGIAWSSGEKQTCPACRCEGMCW